MHRLSLLLFALVLTACNAEPDAAAPTEAMDTAPVPEAATPNSLVLLDYEGTLDDGTVFDSGENVEFYLPQMVAGFQNAIVGMRAGETKTFSIPPEEAYGAEGSGPIPPNATLNFKVTVHEILR